MYLARKITTRARLQNPLHVPIFVSASKSLHEQSLKAELKAKTEALSTIERQRGQYEAMAKAKQQQLDQLAAAGKADKEGLEAKVKDALAKVETAQGKQVTSAAATAATAGASGGGQR